MNSQERFDRLIEELKGVRDAVEQLYTLFDHVYRNREELVELLRGDSDEIEETVLCRECNRGAELTSALRDGWIEVEMDSDGGFVGFCVCCLEEEEAEADAAVIRPDIDREAQTPTELRAPSTELRQRVQGSLGFVD